MRCADSAGGDGASQNILPATVVRDGARGRAEVGVGGGPLLGSALPAGPHRDRHQQGL